MHEYLRNTQYKECNSCNNKSQFTCVKYDYCYSCHWKREKLDKVPSEPLLISSSAFLEQYLQAAIIEQSHQQQLMTEQQQQEQTKVINVYGQEVEPIC
jgi:hypothetical protein